MILHTHFEVTVFQCIVYVDFKRLDSLTSSESETDKVMKRKQFVQT